MPPQVQRQPWQITRARDDERVAPQGNSLEPRLFHLGANESPDRESAAGICIINAVVASLAEIERRRPAVGREPHVGSAQADVLKHEGHGKHE